MGKRTLSQMEKDYIKAIAEEAGPHFSKIAVSTAFVSAIERRDNDRRKIFRETEDLLRAKNLLLDNIAEWKADIENLEIGCGTSRRSSDIMAMANTRLTPEQLLESKIISLKAKIERDTDKLLRLDKAIETIKPDPWYGIIELKYFEEMDDDEIAEQFDCDVRTVRRHKNRLVWRLSVKLTGGEMV